MNMLTLEKLRESLEIFSNKPIENVKQMVDEFEKYFKQDYWPIGRSKDDYLDALQAIHDSELPPDALNPFQMMTDVMEGTTRKLKKLSEEVKQEIKRLQQIVKDAKTIDCEHKKLVIAPFLHGGGLTPILAHAELICMDCGLNVTLHALREGVKNPDKVYREKFGLTIVDKDGVKKLFKWVGNGEEWGGRHDLKNVDWSDNLPSEPQAMYEKSENKWTAPIPFKIINKEILESLSGS